MTQNGRIMTTTAAPRNRVRELRTQARLTQADLAQRAGISRTSVTAIESRRLVPSVTTAIALAEALGTKVEMLFGRTPPTEQSAQWIGDFPQSGRNFWQAEVDGQSWMYPATSTPMLALPPDGQWSEANPNSKLSELAKQTLVVATCDPAAGLLASELVGTTDLRMIILNRSSRRALELLRDGKIHVAGVHLSTSEQSTENIRAVQEIVGSDCQLLRVARWQEGIAVKSSSRLKSVKSATAKLRWIGREPGSGARMCFDRLLGGQVTPRWVTDSHRGVIEAVHAGWADAGVCVQLACVEAGLNFLPIEQECYDLCFRKSFAADRRLLGLLQVLRSPKYRQILNGLPGYDGSDAGQLAEST